MAIDEMSNLPSFAAMWRSSRINSNL